METMIEKLFQELSALSSVDAIALGGSRAGSNYDEKSDYDVYLYCTEPVAEETRKAILSKYCSVMEIGNHFWEYEDNCTLNNGIDIDILYRNLEDFTEDVAAVAERFEARNGYTTCMWHNLLTCRIIYDERGRLSDVKRRFDIPYPPRLRENIIDRNMKLLCLAMPAYEVQIAKAVKRKDVVSINHRVSAFMESYFDILFAVNELTHPGEKRLVQLCKERCKVLPARFEENINCLFASLYTDENAAGENIRNIIAELKTII